MDIKRKGKALASQRDLKSFWNRGSPSASTHASGNDAVEMEEEEQMEEHVVLQQGREVVEENFEGITKFKPEYIISDLGLRIPMDRFAANIRDEVRRAFLS
uniref:Uncharacterized protein n=1 Tax=Oryza glumipatula TaxID=40148 RepID=A0A0E0A8Q8_9ORYZ